MAASRVLSSLLLAIVVAADVSRQKATPIEKVTELLKGLQEKVTAEGKKDAASYDKFACFCKEQADGKLYAIEKSKAKVADLSAQISELESEIAALNGDISKLSGKISKLGKEIDTATAARKKENDKYLVKAKDLSEAIEMCGTAIEALKEAKGSVKDAKINFAQVQNRLLDTATQQSMSSDVLGLIQKLGQPKYEYQSNDIIATLEGLEADLKKMKKELDEAEFDENSIHEKKTLGLSNEKKFAEKEKADKAAVSESKTEELNDAKEQRDSEQKDLNADQAFLDVLTKGCEDKAKLFDQRSKTRSGELQAMSQAIAKLEEGVKPNEGANKKLVGLVQHGELAPSFIQLVHTLNGDGDRAVKHVLDLLQQAAGRLDSKTLESAAVRVEVSKDHFVKVRTLIKDLIAKLKADAAAEAEQKSFCDKAMKKALTSRDDSKSKQEMARAKLAVLTSKKEKLEEEIADLNAQVAANKKALNEASELRAEENAEFQETFASAKSGKAAVEMALTILSDFYSTALVQTKYVPPKSDRDGNTVGDLAPEVSDEEYHGAQAESKGIIGILEIIQEDFTRTMRKIKEEENTAQKEFEKFEKANKEDTDAAVGTIKKDETLLSTTNDDILTQEQGLKDATDVLESSEEKLDELKSSCVEGEETWEERAAKRKAEIEALKEAMTVLEEWQS